jgi:hypothetical protein
MKRIEDIPDGYSILITNSTKSEIEFNFIDRNGDPDHEQCALELTRHNQYYELSNIEATHGWGPFLVDLAMELATLKGHGLYVDSHFATDEAKAMWAKYEKRTDVVSTTMTPQQVNHFSKGRKEFAFPFICKKKLDLVTRLSTRLIDQADW